MKSSPSHYSIRFILGAQVGPRPPPPPGKSKREKIRKKKKNFNFKLLNNCSLERGKLHRPERISFKLRCCVLLNRCVSKSKLKWIYGSFEYRISYKSSGGNLFEKLCHPAKVSSKLVR